MGLSCNTKQSHVQMCCCVLNNTDQMISLKNCIEGFCLMKTTLSICIWTSYGGLMHRNPLYELKLANAYKRGSCSGVRKPSMPYMDSHSFDWPARTITVAVAGEMYGQKQFCGNAINV